MASIALSDGPGDRLTLSLSGRLDTYTVGDIWPDARTAVDRAPSRPIVVDASRVDYCDGGGIALLVDLLRRPRAADAQIEVAGLRPEFRNLLDQFDPVEMRAPAEAPAKPFGGVEYTGRAAAAVWHDVRAQIVFVGEASAALWYALSHPSQVRWKDALAVAEEAGVNALPIVALISFLLGVILAFQSAIPMKQFGAEIFVADLVGLAILRELGPLMTAILLAGRSGAAFAAEIGTMKVNEELNALTTMGLDPVRFLVVTRVIAAVVMTPLLTLFADLVGISGGALTMLAFDIPTVTFFQEISSIVKLQDLFAGLAKTFVFALLIAGIGCLRGLQTQTGASAVGISATRAVVSAIVLLVVADGIFAVIYYIIGI